MKVELKEEEAEFKPIKLEIIFETELEFDQFFSILESQNEQLNELIFDPDWYLDDTNDGWLDHLANRLQGFERKEEI